MTDLQAAGRSLSCGRYVLALDRPLIMGIVNATPDSFFDGGRHATADAAIAHARRLLDEGADLLDIGGESTRPGSAPVTREEELARIAPVIEALRDCGRPLSVDTRHPAVMHETLALGADMINDVAGFREPGAIEAVAAGSAGLCVMHMLGEPSTMQRAPGYRDVVAEVSAFLRERVAALLRAGVDRSRIVVDPGIGFGKTHDDNLALMRALPVLGVGGLPVLIGLSRKSMIGRITGREPEGRLAGSVAGALAAARAGAAIVRVHDVAETRDALEVWKAIGS